MNEVSSTPIFPLYSEVLTYAIVIHNKFLQLKICCPYICDIASESQETRTLVF